MYDQSYEEYMNSVLGVRNNMMQMPNPMLTQMNTYQGMNNLTYPMMPEMQQTEPVEMIEEMYPDMYKLVFPMVVKRCETVNGPVTDNLVNQLTDEIYNSVGVSEVEAKPEVRSEMPMNKRNLQRNIKETETRQFGRHNPLRDIIRILLLRQLIDGRFPGHRHDHRHRRPHMHRASYGPYAY